MNGTVLWVVWLAAAYLAGSIPFGLLIGRAKGVDIRLHGSGNVGATNVGRVLGRKWGALCFLLDVGKGLAPVLSYSLVTDTTAAQGAGGALQGLAIAAAAILGHVFPIWLRFRGGKGVATGLGVLLGLWPVLTVAAIGAGMVWLIVVKAFGYVSLASISAAVALPVLALASAVYHGLTAEEAAVYVTVSALLAALVVVRHRSNMVKLRAGTEPRTAWAKKG